MGHDDRVDQVNHAIRLEYIHDPHQRCAALLVLEHDVLSTRRHDPQFTALDGCEFRCTLAFPDLPSSAQTCSDVPPPRDR